jgi:menaquinol-cytochrome c reductase cytochrome b/c subunit
LAHHSNDSNEKVVYVGDSRVVKKNNVNVPHEYSANPGKSEQFIPNFLLKEWLVGSVVMVGFMCLVLSEAAPLGYPADPNNTGFIPMPDWYFLFLYQVLKYPYFSGNYVVLGTLGVSGVAFGALLLAPFLDTGKERRFYRRPIASLLMIVSLIATIYLTNVSWAHYELELKEKGAVPEYITREEKLKAGTEDTSSKKTTTAEVAIVDKDSEGAKIFAKATCVSCHGTDLKGMASANIPALRGVGDQLKKEDILGIMKKGRGAMPAQYDANKANGLSDKDLDTLATWLASQKKS